MVNKTTAKVMVLLEHPTNDNTSWGVIFPTIDGCHSAGDTVEQLMVNIREAVEFHTYECPVMAEDVLSLAEIKRPLEEWEVGLEQRVYELPIWVTGVTVT